MNGEGSRILAENCAITVTRNLFFVAKIDFIHDMRLLILRNLLETRMCRKIPRFRDVMSIFIACFEEKILEPAGTRNARFTSLRRL